MDEQLRQELMRILSDIRAGMIANKYKAPVFPPLQAAERRLLGLLFSEQEVNQYYSSTASEIYRPTE